MSLTDAEYEVEQINKNLIGSVILKAISSPDGERFGLIVKHKNENKFSLIIVSSDEEKNSSGSLDIKELRKDQVKNENKFSLYIDDDDFD